MIARRLCILLPSVILSHAIYASRVSHDIILGTLGFLVAGFALENYQVTHMVKKESIVSI